MVQLPERCDENPKLIKQDLERLLISARRRIRRVIRIKEKETPNANSRLRLQSPKTR